MGRLRLLIVPLPLVLVALIGGSSILQAAPNATPVRGGTLRYALDGDGQGFNPVTTPCAQACKTIGRSIFDPLAALDANSDVVPYLAKKIFANPKRTVWTIVARPGIKFHNGEVLDGAAIRDNLEAQRKGINGPGLAIVKSVDLEGKMTVKVKLSGPSVRFDEALTAEAGWMMAPSTLADKNAGLKPIGTGPFVFKEWKQTDRLTVVRNKNYWRKGLPLLDQIIFVPITDAAARTAAVTQGQVDMAMTNNNGQIARLRKNKSVKTLETTYAASTDEFVLNNQYGPTSDIRVRRALAYATDQKAIQRIVGQGVPQIANGPFPPGNIGYKAKNVYPTYNLAKAQEIVRAYEAAKGPLKLTLQVVPGDTVRGQLAKSMWERAGMDINLITKEPTPQIIDLLTGKYEVAPGALPGMPDPDGTSVFWRAATLLPLGQFSFNYARIVDPVLERSLTTLRENRDRKVRVAAARTINDRFASKVYAIWTYWTVWALTYNNKVHDPAVITLPNGKPSAPYREGTNWVAQIYKTR